MWTEASVALNTLGDVGVAVDVAVVVDVVVAEPWKHPSDWQQCSRMLCLCSSPERSAV